MTRSYLPVVVCSVCLWVAAAGAAERAGVRMWVHDRPVPVPRDYVYRTGRVDEGVDWPWLARSGGRKEDDAVSGARLRAAAARMAAELAREGRGRLPDGSRVAVASFVDLNDLYHVSGLGRCLGEEVLAGLVRAGIGVVEVRKSAGLLLRRKGGEFALSRDIGQLDPVRDARAVVVGTYVSDGGEVLINARMLDNRDSRVLATASAVLPAAGMVARLLAREDGEVLPRQQGGGVVRIRQGGGR